MKNKKKIYILVGISGSGKSTWLQNHKKTFAIDHAIISRDTIRFSMLKEGEDYFAREKDVWKEFIHQIKDSLVVNTETFVDATHLNERSRGKLLRALRNYLSNVSIEAIYFKVSLPVALSRNNLRKGIGRTYVPPEQIERMYSQLTEPSFEEGFNVIWVWEDKKNMLIKKMKE